MGLLALACQQATLPSPISRQQQGDGSAPADASQLASTSSTQSQWLTRLLRRGLSLLLSPRKLVMMAMTTVVEAVASTLRARLPLLHLSRLWPWPSAAPCSHEERPERLYHRKVEAEERSKHKR